MSVFSPRLKVCFNLFISLGPKRQVYDRSYYLQQIRTKNNELSREIQNFKKEVEDINKDNATYMTLEKKYDNLIKEVRQLEGDLADINLAQDKFRTDTKTEDIYALFNHIKMQNDR